MLVHEKGCPKDSLIKFLFPNTKMLPIVGESHIFQRQQRATLGYKSLKVCKKIIVRTDDVKDILDAA